MSIWTPTHTLCVYVTWCLLWSDPCRIQEENRTDGQTKAGFLRRIRGSDKMKSQMFSQREKYCYLLPRSPWSIWSNYLFDLMSSNNRVTWKRGLKSCSSKILLPKEDEGNNRTSKFRRDIDTDNTGSGQRDRDWLCGCSAAGILMPIPIHTSHYDVKLFSLWGITGKDA